PLRECVYGVIESLGIMSKVLAEKETKRALKIKKELGTNCSSDRIQDSTELASDLKKIAHFREKASTISSSDVMGNVILNTLELITLLVESNLNVEKLQSACKSLEKRRHFYMEMDGRRNSPLRECLYGVCESLRIVIEELVEKENEKKRKAQLIKNEPISNAQSQEEHDDLFNTSFA
ncbi:hypothetical protein PENTCL1PPCAC_20010, partial [Pristionchus entomophagus]